jgi:hypothetical protein
MHSAIIVVEMPEVRFDATSNPTWENFLARVDRLTSHKPDLIDKQKGVERLGENVWLVNFLQNPAALARLVEAAVRMPLHYKILQLDAAPQWLPVAAKGAN